MLFSKLSKNLPLALMAGAFLALASSTRCTQDEAVGSGSAQPTSTACNNDGDCPLPASQCGSSSELDYYSDAKCVQGKCTWQRQTMGCSCYAGGCQGTTTTSGSVSLTGGGQAGDIDVEAGESQDPLSDAPIDHATAASPDGGPCTNDDDASTCGDPPSVCADEHWLAFFTNGSCQQNRCQWQVAYRDCGGLGCYGGGCVMNVTK